MSSSVPKIGCQHFKSLVKQILAENNTLCSALCDILDNVHGIGAIINAFKAICDIRYEYDDTSLYKITIADNILHGFKDIHKDSTQNPLNMGHIRIGQSTDDRETSEFGTGLKKALIFLAKNAEIFTRCVDDEGNISFVRVVFDFVEMVNRVNPEESYEPTRFERISEQTFRENHPYDTGSSIILSNLRDSDITFDAVRGVQLTCDDFETGFRKEISDKMSNLIRDEVIQITVNGKEVEEKDDLVVMVQDTKVNTFYVDFNGKGEICEVYRETFTKSERLQIKHYEKSECKFKKGSEDEFNAFKEKPSVKAVDMVSLTTKGTPYEETHQRNDLTAVKRNGRCFGEVKITKQEKDGYSNHIYHEINYTSKKLNTHLGVGSNKRVVSDKSNILMSAIHITQKELNSKFRGFCRTKLLTDSSSDTDGEPVARSKPKPKPKTKAPKPVLQEEPEDIFAVLMDEPVAEVAVAEVELVDLFAQLLDEPVAQIMAELQGELDAAELQVMSDLQQQVPTELKVEVKEQMTISEGIELLNIILGNENSPTIIEEITNILTNIYLLGNSQAKIALMYVPLNNARIQMLIEIIEQAHPEEERGQPIDKNAAAAISSLLRLLVN